MPLLTLNDVKVFNNYKAELKTNTVKAKAQTLPFRYVKEFQFDAGKKPLLLIGKLPPTLLADLKKAEATVKVKALGLCRLVGESLEFQVDKGSLVDAESDKALDVAGIARPTKVVPALSDGSAAKHAQLDAAALVQRLGTLNERLDKVRSRVPAVAPAQLRELDSLAARLKQHAAGTEKVDSNTSEELLDEFETKLVAVEHADRIAASNQRADDERQLGSGGADDDAPRLQRLDAANKQVDAKTTAPKLAEPKPLEENPDYVMAMKTLEVATQMSVAATAWHNKEIKTQQDAEAKLPQAQLLVDALEVKIAAVEAKIVLLNANIVAQGKARDEASKFTPGVAKKATVQIEKDQASIAKLQAQIAKIRSEPAYVALKTLTSQANKHGSARHGAQTGVELQARRTATGGTSPDQPDNPHGTSQPRADGGGAPLNSIKWNKVTVTWEDEPGGKRKVVNKQEVLKNLAEETHLAKTSKSSMFISHVLEKEAVDRAIAIANGQCPWTEWKDGDEWKPIDAVTIVLGKPKKLAGWGYAVGRDVDPKKTLVDANAVIEDFRNGKIDQAAMLKGLDTSFATADDGSVPLVKEVRVTLGRMGGAWSSITHFPSAGETVGWNIAGRTVRRSAKAAEEVVPPAFREA